MLLSGSREKWQFSRSPHFSDAIAGGHYSPAPVRVAFDVTRLIAHRWSGKRATGIDRVAYAYLAHYRATARAVVQFMGARRIFTARHSAELFDLLFDESINFRRRILAYAPRALALGRTTPPCDGAFYINVAHTDLERADLGDWVRACNLRPIYMLHDLIPLTHAEYCTPRATRRHRQRLYNALDHAAGIITNSESTAQDIRHAAAEAGRCVPPLLANWLAGTHFRTASAEPVKAGAYFVYVSTREGRKNHLMLLQVWRQLVERMGDDAPHLVVIGQKGTQAAHVENMLQQCIIIREHVTVLPHCADEELGDWISGARALLFPSFAEGFGLPLVEALELGTPVIASDIATFREIGQNIPMLLNPLDARAWEDAIVAFTRPCPERERQLGMMEGFRPPTWLDHFGALDAWLESLDGTCRPFGGHPVGADISRAVACSLSPANGQRNRKSLD